MDKESWLEKHRRNRHAYKKDGGAWGYKDYRTIRKLKKEFCEECGAEDNLHLHHIDQDPRNSYPANLNTLCCSCHKKLHYSLTNNIL